MQQTGVILETCDFIAKVAIVKNPVCIGCHGCISLSGQEHMPVMRADNHLQAPVGARVEVEIPPRQVLGGAVMVFMFPLLMLGLGYWITTTLFAGTAEQGQSLGILGAFIGLAVGFLILRLIDRLWAQKHRVDGVIVQFVMPQADEQQPANCPVTRNS